MTAACNGGNGDRQLFRRLGVRQLLNLCQIYSVIACFLTIFLTLLNG
jgi:hypothetical protein